MRGESEGVGDEENLEIVGDQEPEDVDHGTLDNVGGGSLWGSQDKEQARPKRLTEGEVPGRWC